MAFYGRSYFDALNRPQPGRGQLDARAQMEAQAGKSGAFADTGEGRFGTLGAEGDALRAQLAKYASGEESLSREQLRQALGQQFSQQRSMAAGASPANSPMAARTAAMNMGRASTAMSGQAAQAGIQERQAAQNALAQFLAEQRRQELQAALGGRGLALQGYGQSVANPERSFFDQLLGAVSAGAGAYGAINNPGGGGG